MEQYRVVTFQDAASDGYETTIAGPGIPASGLPYWFDSKDEAYIFVENLNLSLSEAKRLAKWRKLYLRKLA